jgi:hypothetical protein
MVALLVEINLTKWPAAQLFEAVGQEWMYTRRRDLTNGLMKGSYESI